MYVHKSNKKLIDQQTLFFFFFAQGINIVQKYLHKYIH